MRLSLTVFVSLAVLACEVSASMMSPAHHRIARRLNRKKRCIERNANVSNPDFGIQNVSPSSSSSSAAAAPSPPPPAPAPAPAPAPPPQSGTIRVQSNCGDIGASSACSSPCEVPIQSDSDSHCMLFSFFPHSQLRPVHWTERIIQVAHLWY